MIVNISRPNALATRDRSQLWKPNRRHSDGGRTLSIMRSPQVVFDHRVRADPRPARATEEFGAFLDRVDQPYFAACRALINDWYSHYPPGEDKTDLARRLRDTQVNHLGAFWELWLHEMCLRSGFAVEVHPTSPDGRRRDFRVTAGNDSFYLEAHCSYSSDTKRRESKRLEEFKERLAARLTSSFQWVVLHVDEVGPNALSASALAARINEIGPGLAPWRDHQLQVDESGWRLKITITGLPRDRTALPASQLVADSWSFHGSMDELHHKPIRDAIATKAARASRLDLPYVVAVNMCLRERFLLDAEDVRNALSGTYTTVMNHDLEVVDRRLNEDGVWSGGRTGAVSALVFANHMNVGQVARGLPTLHLAPAATHPFEVPLPLPVALDEPGPEGKLEFAPASRPAHELFGLPEGWPGCDTFEKPYTDDEPSEVG